MTEEQSGVFSTLLLAALLMAVMHISQTIESIMRRLDELDARITLVEAK
jgi:hypothetical protein